jgi:tetratricopeptide (TPR) repeat protein
LGFGNCNWWGWPSSYWCGGYPYYGGGYCYPYYPSYSYPAYYPNYYAPVYYEPIYIPYPVESTSQPASESSGGASAPSGNSYPSEGRMPAPAQPQNVSNEKLADRYVSLGDVYFQLSRYDRALEAYEKAVQYAPSDANLRFILCDAMFANGRFAEAAEAIRGALRIDPALVESRADKRTFYSRTADFDAQVSVLEGWLQNHTENADGWLVLGYNRYFRGELEKAREAFRKAREATGGETRVASDLFLAAIEVRLSEGEGSAPASHQIGK